MSKTIATLITLAAQVLTAPQRAHRRILTKALAAERLKQNVVIESDGGPLIFACSTARAAHDPLNFGRDEPETLWWIDNCIEPAQCVWDIGANIGLYALYAARRAQAHVVAIEPSAASFAELMRNVELNGLSAQVDALCVALAGRTGLDHLHMANTGAGHSMHGFGTMRNAEGEINPAFSQAVLGFTIDELAALPGIRRPDHVKLDVDGIEEAILRGAAATLQTVKTVLVEDVRSGGDTETPVARLLLDEGYDEVSVPVERRWNRLFRKK